MLHIWYTLVHCEQHIFALLQLASFNKLCPKIHCVWLWEGGNIGIGWLKLCIIWHQPFWSLFQCICCLVYKMKPVLVSLCPVFPLTCCPNCWTSSKHMNLSLISKFVLKCSGFADVRKTWQVHLQSQLVCGFPPSDRRRNARVAIWSDGNIALLCIPLKTLCRWHWCAFLQRSIWSFAELKEAVVTQSTVSHWSWHFFYEAQNRSGAQNKENREKLCSAVKAGNSTLYNTFRRRIFIEDDICLVSSWRFGWSGRLCYL